MSDQQILTVPEAAELARVSRAHMYRLVSDGTVSAVRLGKRVVVPRHEIEKLLRIDAR